MSCNLPAQLALKPFNGVVHNITHSCAILDRAIGHDHNGDDDDDDDDEYGIWM